MDVLGIRFEDRKMDVMLGIYIWGLVESWIYEVWPSLGVYIWRAGYFLTRYIEFDQIFGPNTELYAGFLYWVVDGSKSKFGSSTVIPHMENTICLC